MAWRCEVKTRGGWLVVDEERGEVGKRLVSRSRYERLLLRAQPYLRLREYRITQFHAPKIRTLFTMSFDIPKPPTGDAR